MKKIILLCMGIAAVADGSVKVVRTVAAEENRSIDISVIEKMLNAISTLTTNFVQIDKMDNRSEGRSFLDRKRRLMKMDYTVPNDHVIVIKGDRVIHYDRDLKEKTESSYYSSPLSFLMDRKIDLKKNVKIMSDTQDENVRRVKITKNIDDDVGAIELMLSVKKPIRLVGWVVYDKKNDLYGTEVYLKNTEYGKSIDVEEFDKI